MHKLTHYNTNHYDQRVGLSRYKCFFYPQKTIRENREHDFLPSSTLKKLTLVKRSLVIHEPLERSVEKIAETTESISYARKKKKQRGMATDKERKLLLLTDRLVGERRLDETSGRRTQVVSFLAIGTGYATTNHVIF